MVWLRLEDQWLMNAKVRKAGKDGRALWIAGALHCAAQLTDGVIPTSVVPILCAQAEVKPASLRVLVDVGLWHEITDGYLINDWTDYQPTRVEVEERRSQTRSAKAAGAAATNHKRWHTDRGVSDPECDLCESLSDKSATVERVAKRSPHPIPSHPDPFSTHVLPTNQTGSPPSGLVEASKMWAEQQYARAKVGVVKNPSVWKRRIIDRLLVEVVVPDGCSAEEAFRLIEDHEYAA